MQISISFIMFTSSTKHINVKSIIVNYFSTDIESKIIALLILGTPWIGYGMYLSK